MRIAVTLSASVYSAVSRGTPEGSVPDTNAEGVQVNAWIAQRLVVISQDAPHLTHDEQILRLRLVLQNDLIRLPKLPPADAAPLGVTSRCLQIFRDLFRPLRLSRNALYVSAILVNCR